MSDEAFSMNLDGGRRDDSRGEGSSAGVHSAPAVPAPTRREKRKRTSPPEDEFVNTPWKDLLPKDKEYYSVEQKWVKLHFQLCKTWFNFPLQTPR